MQRIVIILHEESNFLTPLYLSVKIYFLIALEAQLTKYLLALFPWSKSHNRNFLAANVYKRKAVMAN